MLVCHVVIDLAFSSGHIENMYDILEFLIVCKLSCKVGRRFEFPGFKMKGLAVVEDGGIKDLRFNEVLEDMASVRQLGIIARLCFLHLAYDLKST